MQFGTLLVDPPWNYSRARNDKRTGYCADEYPLMTTQDLMDLPVADLGTDESVLLLWTTWPFISDALELIKAWDYEYVTGLTWIKTMEDTHKVAYGVGYWFRGATELILVGKRRKAFRTNLVGLGTDFGVVSPRLDHSKKPESIYEVAECMDGPFLEMFARRLRSRWYSLGNECPGDGMDIRDRLVELAQIDDWEKHLCLDGYVVQPVVNRDDKVFHGGGDSVVPLSVPEDGDVDFPVGLDEVA